MLQVILGIVLILLVLSLFATTIMEIINSVFSLRGKFLEKGLAQLLASSGRTNTLEAFLNNPRYKQLTSTFLLRERPPSYMSAQSFSSILLNVFENENKDVEDYSQIKDQHLRDLLMEFNREAGYERDKFQQKLEDWYEEVMDRTKGWFKRNNQILLLFLGLGIAVAFDADTIGIFQNLSNDPEAQLELSMMADQYFASSDSTATDSLSMALYQQELKSFVASNFEAIREPLGLGWYAATLPNGVYEWFMKFLGWIITAIAISLGAPFWFDLLRKVMNISTAGVLSPQPNIPSFYPIANTPSAIEKVSVTSIRKQTRSHSPTSTASTISKGQENIIESYG